MDSNNKGHENFPDELEHNFDNLGTGTKLTAGW